MEDGRCIGAKRAIIFILLSRIGGQPMLFLSFSDNVFSLWSLTQLSKSKNDHLANIFPHIFSCRQISGVTVTFMYWRRYDFSPLRQCCAIVVLLPMAVILCFVLQKWWRAIIKMVEQKSAGIFLILTFGRKMSAGVGLIPAQRRNPKRFFGSFPDYISLSLKLRCRLAPQNIFGMAYCSSVIRHPTSQLWPPNVATC